MAAHELTTRFLSEWSHAALGFVFPGRCLLCDVPLETARRDQRFCIPCEIELRAHVGENQCARCGEPLGPNLRSEDLCAVCRKEKYAFERVIRWGVYAGRLQSACLLGKKPGGERAMTGVAQLAWPDLSSLLSSEEIDLVIPVPRYWLQRLAPGHASSEILARRWGRQLKVRCASRVLKKIKWTRKQVGLSHPQRWDNLRGAFGVPFPRKVAGKRILLVDDVLTTGSTAHHAARALKKAGAAAVIVAVLARSRYSRT